MQKEHKESIFSVMILAALFILAGFLGGFSDFDRVRAGAEHTIYGYAWSSNVGWISFNCTNEDTCDTSNYGVDIEGNNDLSGYAWNDNIGWISFNSSDLSGCPQGACRAKLTGSNVTGWARAIGGNAEADAWDGWIHLDGHEDSVTLDGNQLEGFAWSGGQSSEVIGWIDFNPGFSPDQYGCTGVCICTDPDGCSYSAPGEPFVNLSANPTSVDSGTNSTLTWDSEEVLNCVALGGTPDWFGPKSPTGNQVVGPITSEVTYTLDCEDSGGNDVDDDATVSINPPDFSLLKSGNIEVEFTGGGATSTATTITVFAVNGFSDTVSLSASPATLGGISAVYEFSDNSLSSSEYVSGSTFEVYLSEPIPTGNYPITITGVDGGLIRNIGVTLSVDSTNIIFEEF